LASIEKTALFQQKESGIVETAKNMVPAPFLAREGGAPRQPENNGACRRPPLPKKPPLDFLALAARFRENYGMNSFIVRHIKVIEMIGVLMRVFSFSLVSWLGPKSPFMFVWIFNTTDAVMLTWCATLKRDNAYMVLNGFWILVGLVGILRAGNILH
jgi:hypothetical protein